MKPNVLRIQLDRRLFGERSRKRKVVLAVPGRLIGHSQRPNGPELRDSRHAYARFTPRFLTIPSLC